MTVHATRLRKCLFTITASLFVSLLLAVAAQAQHNIHFCPYTISEPGEWVLANDLINCRDGIIIETRGPVVFKLTGHKIVGGEGQGVRSVGIWMRSDGTVRVEGPGTISNFNLYAGMRIDGFTDQEVSGVTFMDNAIGILASDGNIRVHGNFVLHNQDGIDAITHFNGGTAEFTGNLIAENQESGFVVENKRSGELRIHDNIILSNGQYGISALDNSHGNDITSNTVLYNPTDDMFDENGNCEMNTWTNNTFQTKNPGCIH